VSAALRWPAAVSKEVRALLPAWLACTATVAAGGLAGSMQLLPIAMFACVLGTVALGAHAMGHEYTHRTLGLLLSQPSTRPRLFLTKISVLGAMLSLLMAVAWVTIIEGPLSDRVRGFNDPRLALLITMCGLFVAPCLTMICRNPLAAVVFTISIPGVLLVAGELLAIARFGFGAYAQVDRARLAFLIQGMYIACGAAAVGSWMLFMRLEAVEGRGTEFHLPRWWSATTDAPAERPNAVWQLVKKELRLQQMTFVVAGFYVLGWASLRIVARLVPEIGEAPLEPLSVLYVALLSLVIGSLASAEERQFGTLEWQVLLPIASWQQWAIKVSTACALALLLGAGMPLMLAAVDPSPDELHMVRELGVEVVLIALVMTSGGVYLSSICSSGMRAVVLALPVIFVVLFLVFEGGRWMSRALSVVPPDFFRVTVGPGLQLMSIESWAFLLLAGGALPLLWFGMQNHRSAERSYARVGAQVAWIAAYAIIAVALITAFDIAARTAWLMRAT
jgi:ABC-2 family transporter protein